MKILTSSFQRWIECKHKMPTSAIFLLKIIISIALIAYLVQRIDTHSLAQIMESSNALTAVGVATMVFVATALLHAQRWILVISASGGRLAFIPAVKAVLIGYFFSQALPSTVGGDAMRAWCARNAGLDLPTALSSVVVDRFVALVGLLIFPIVTLPWLLDLIVEPETRIGLAMVFTLIGFGFAALLGFVRLPLNLRRWKFVAALTRLSEDAGKVFLNWRHALVTILLSVVANMVTFFVVFMLARSLGIQLGIEFYLLLMPPVWLATLLPISIAGWGVREGAMIMMLGLVQVPATSAFALSVLLGIATMGSGLPGLILWWANKRTNTKSV